MTLYNHYSTLIAGNTPLTNNMQLEQITSILTPSQLEQLENDIVIRTTPKQSIIISLIIANLTIS